MIEGRLEKCKEKRIPLLTGINCEKELHRAIDKIFEGGEENYKSDDCMAKNVIFNTKNVFISEINTKAGSKIPVNPRKLKRSDSV